ncbi:MAG: ribonuclease HI [Armatimonadota bacterium]
MLTYHVYTDGSCKVNPGPGAAAVVFTTPEGEIVKEFVKAVPQTTNNRMEMLAVIGALKAMEKAHLIIFTDSQYVYNGITSWIHGWKRNGWKTASKKPVENQDLWVELDALKSGYAGQVEFRWVRGHNGTPGNERADVLAQEAAAELQNCR